MKYKLGQKVYFISYVSKEEGNYEFLESSGIVTAIGLGDFGIPAVTVKYDKGYLTVFEKCIGLSEEEKEVFRKDAQGIVDFMKESEKMAKEIDEELQSKIYTDEVNKMVEEYGKAKKDVIEKRNKEQRDLVYALYGEPVDLGIE